MKYILFSLILFSLILFSTLKVVGQTKGATDLQQIQLPPDYKFDSNGMLVYCGNMPDTTNKKPKERTLIQHPSEDSRGHLTKQQFDIFTNRSDSLTFMGGVTGGGRPGKVKPEKGDYDNFRGTVTLQPGYIEKTIVELYDQYQVFCKENKLNCEFNQDFIAWLRKK